MLVHPDCFYVRPEHLCHLRIPDMRDAIVIEDKATVELKRLLAFRDIHEKSNVIDRVAHNPSGEEQHVIGFIQDRKNNAPQHADAAENKQNYPSQLNITDACLGILC